MKIKVLSEDTINKIAAGEVVERPASVVKELIENSIDAGADQVDIEILGSGKRLIRITDNGSGMSKDDAVLAFQRHATSKIDSADDLVNIHTLGFRGEALPSIASVSKVEMITKISEIQSATKIVIEGGKLIEVKETGAPAGTSICVRSLFFNTPARRKFLKSDITEMTHITNIVSQYCLTYVTCGFKLIQDKEVLIDVFKKDNLKERIRILYGEDAYNGITPVDFQEEGVKITGFISTPVFTAPNRTYQFLFVNNRPVSSKSISYGIYEAYSTLIPKGRYPSVFLFIDVDPASLDVNVHPTKKEVRFDNEKKIQIIVQKAIYEGLKIKKDVKQQSPEYTHAGFGGINVVSSQKDFVGKESFEGYNPHSFVSSEVYKALQELPVNKTMQVHNSYLIRESKEGIEIIDQHAIHERVLYEKLKKLLTENRPEVQRLLIPINIELNKQEHKLIKNEIGLLENIGFGIGEFGDNTLIIDAIPVILDKTDIAGLIRDMAKEIIEKGKGSGHNQIEDAIIKMIACKAAVKQGDKLENIQINEIIKQWHELDLPYTCPHGRPAVFAMTNKEIDKKFHR